MALRKIREYGDSILRKKSKVVKDINSSVLQLLDDMADTMAHKDGVGLAAVQVGILKRIVVVDNIEDEDSDIIELINPEIVEMSGTQSRNEACLSVIGRSGIVERPQYVKVKALNRHGEEITVEGEGFLAVALCHELDHLDGVLYIDKMIEDTSNKEDDEE